MESRDGQRYRTLFMIRRVNARHRRPTGENPVTKSRDICTGKFMSNDVLKQELESFLEAYPDTRYMDVFSPDINGILRGKRLPRDEFGKIFGNGANFCAATPLMNCKGQSSDKVKYGARDGDPDAKGVAIAGSLAPVPWATLPTAQCLLEPQEFDGTPLFLDPRNVLKEALKPLQNMGLKPVMATELEFYLIRHDGTRFVPRLPTIPGSELLQDGVQFACFEDLDDVEPFLVDLDSYCQQQNIPAGAALSEYSPGQFEVNLNHVDDPLLACDHAILLKRAVKAAARKNGLAATFMAKPFAQHAGNGLHMHVSLLDADGNNVFSGQSKDGDFSDTLRHAIGGLAASMSESMAVFAPNANSYRRYAPNFFVPATPNWGPNHRDLAMRIPISSQKNRRVEHRVAGADGNPYLVVAAVMAGIHHGIKNQLDPGPMVPEKQEIEYKITLPIRWPYALDVFDAGVFGVCRREEADMFHSEVTDKDYEWYLRAV
jgi:glutamine synthetase